jgi:ABC-type polysaccharide/polyol phosphate transport system ATPase subunit
MSLDPGVRAAAPSVSQALPAIEAQDVSASYRVRLDAKDFRADLRRVFTRKGNDDRLVPALRDVTFDVPSGSVLAVIGRNGAGKSTLLRTLAGILAPEQGRIIVRGRVNLLAVGLGFNEAMTGRENIKLGGLAVGLSEARVAAITDEIADFAQLGEYIEFPIKTYSTGMRARLGFAVAAHLEPEILLIDEALTGGDAAFQQHIAHKMASLCGEGRTIVLVTHGLSSVSTMATEAMWMHQGRVEDIGDPDVVVGKYMRYCRLESMDLEFDDQ